MTKVCEKIRVRDHFENGMQYLSFLSEKKRIESHHQWHHIKAHGLNLARLTLGAQDQLGPHPLTQRIP